MEIKVIQVGDKNFKLMFEDFEEELDIDSLLKIDYSNLIGEIITFPVIVNRFGILLAEAESQAAEARLNLEVFEAKTKEKLRIELTEQNGGKSPTVEALNNVVASNKAYQVMRKKLIEAQKTRDYINSIFWASKDKSEKLNKLSLTIQQGDITSNMIEGKINNILIKQTKKLID